MFLLLEPRGEFGIKTLPREKRITAINAEMDAALRLNLEYQTPHAHIII